MAHPPCGLYRTTKPLGELPAGRLVYFHNHGEPGPGVYTPHRWASNRVEWHSQGATVPDEAYSASLEPLAPEGLYRVKEPFFCCEKQCRKYEAELLVQLGYDASAEAIVFVPEWVGGALSFPPSGMVVSQEKLTKVVRLAVPESTPRPTAGGLVH